MKKVVSIILMAVLLMSSVSFADMTAVPVLIKAPLFEVTYDQDQFTITFPENPSTGYSWFYTINDESLVSYISDETIASEVEIPGAAGQHAFTFESTGKGVSTISFESKRPWENEAVDTIEILVYKTEEKLIVEEDQIVTIQDDMTIEPISYEPTMVYVNEILVQQDVNPQVIDGITMIPLAETLRAMGYQVTWNVETKSVDIQKGAQWTSIQVGKNAYFKNRMAPSPLSTAPAIVEGRTMVPAEFFSRILSLGFEIESGQLKMSTSQMGYYEGYVKSMEYDETGAMQIHLVYDLDTETPDVIIHTSDAFTYFNTTVEEGKMIHVVSSMVTTMSMPPQTSGYVIY